MTPRQVTRLTVPIAAVSVLLLILAIAAAWSVRDMQARASGPIASSVFSVTAAQELEISMREVFALCNRYLVTLDRKYLERVPELKQRTADALANAETAANLQSEQALMHRMCQGYTHFFAEFDKVLRNPPPQGLYPRIIELIDTVLTKEVLDPTHEYLRLNEKILTQASETNQQVANWLTIGLLTVGLCGSAGGLLAGWVIAATVRRSLRRTEERLRATARQLDAAVPGNEGVDDLLPDDTIERMSVSVSAVLQRLRQTERDALRAEQLAWVGQMAAGIAHEIRNPLAAIKLLVQAASDRPGGPALRPRDFRVLEEEIARLETIVAGFLDFARPPRPDPRAVDVIDLTAKVIDGLEVRSELQGVTIAVESTKEPVIARADPNQLRQVLLNLLFNAFDAQPRGGNVQVVAKIDQTNPTGQQLLVTVQDSGPGLPPDVGDRIFEPFVSTKESGLGLGLSICRRIAEAHGGTLTAANRPEGGATFTLRIPSKV